MRQDVRETVAAAQDAIRRHAWEEARSLLAAVDSEGGLDAEGLRQLGKMAEWCGDLRGTVDAFERSYAAFVALDDRKGAANVALMLRHVCVNMLRDVAAARGWVQRAEHLLEDEPECIVHGYLWRAKGRRAYLDGDPETGRHLMDRAIALGRRLGDANLVAMSQSWLGIGLWETGHREEAFAALDEACAAAVGGELGPWATGTVYCNAIGVYRDAGEFGLGSEWTQSAQRWCRRESITGFTGICSVHRAEFLRLRGALADAEQQARRASGELEGTTPSFAGEASYEIGMIRLRLGDLEGADDAFRRAHELGREPQPGAAMLLAARGDRGAALRSLQTSSSDPAVVGVLDAMRCLAAQAELACELGDLAAADGAVQKAEEVATGQPGIGLQVLAVQARAAVQLARSDLEAHKTLRRALKLWQQIDAPYEVAEVRLLLARALRQLGDSAGARREVEAAAATFERLGAMPDAARAKDMLDSSQAPTVAARTLFFSDIVGSTQLVEAIGDQAWNDLVAWLDGSLRQCFAAHGGEEVDHAGDGFFVAFPDSKSALDCAVTIQRKLADHRREHGFAPRLRIGVHATSASHMAGRYRGRGVHEASRIAALAGPDEILASRESVPPGFAGSDPQTIKVKGISKPIEMVRVDWAR